MPDNITTSNFKKPPKGFVLVLILILLTEGVLYAARAGLITDYWNKFLINEYSLLEQKKSYDYLILGNSIQKTGIDASEIAGDVLNLGLPGAKPMGHYLMLKRYLKKHAAPKVIFWYPDPEDPRDSFFVILRYFVNPAEFFEIFGDLTWEERKVFLGRYFASLDHRKVGLTVRDKYEGSNEDFIRAMKRNQGYMPLPQAAQSIPEDYFLKNRERVQQKVSLDTRDLSYIKKLTALAKKHNIRLVVIGMVLPRQLHSLLEDNGFLGDYRGFLNQLKEEHPEIGLDPNPAMFLDTHYFGDPSHVNAEGSRLYTEYFKLTLYGAAESAERASS